MASFPYGMPWMPGESSERTENAASISAAMRKRQKKWRAVAAEAQSSVNGVQPREVSIRHGRTVVTLAYPEVVFLRGETLWKGGGSADAEREIAISGRFLAMAVGLGSYCGFPGAA